MSTRSGGFERDGGYPAKALHAIRHRWILVLCVALSVSAGSVAVEVLGGPEYTAQALVKAQDLGQAGTGQASRERLREIQAAAGPEEVSRKAMKKLGWEDGIRKFEHRLDLQVTDQGALEVSFSADSPERAAAGANAYARAFVNRVERLDKARLAGGAPNASAEVSREAQPPPSAVVSRTAAAGLVALLPGLVAGGALALTLGGRGRRWRGTRDAELTLGAPVLGVIPDHGSQESRVQEAGNVR